MKVALCHHYSLSFHGGGERFLIEVAKQLKKRGHETTIYALPFGRRPINIGEFLQGIDYNENIIHNINDSDVAYFIYAPIVHHLFIGRCPKIAALHAFVFANELQHPEIRSMNYVNYVKEFGFSKFISRLYFNKSENKKLKNFNAIHVINRQALKIFHENKHVYYVPNWIDTSLYKPVEEKNQKFSVLFTGRKTKGFSFFVKIAELLKNKEIDFLAIGPDLESINNVKNLGFITDLEQLVSLYSKVHVLVYASKIDVFPLTLLEASACKVPIVALPTEAIKGLDLPLFYATSIQEFAQIICQLQHMWKTEKDYFIKIANNMREQVLKYDVDNVFPKFLEMLREVATSFAK
jgi:glycosyltransferase involved in cell wall biosynthesis